MDRVELDLANLPIVGLTALGREHGHTAKEGFIEGKYTVVAKALNLGMISEIRTERWAYLVDRMLGLNIVPPTVIRMVDQPQPHSVQYWIHNGKPTKVSYKDNNYQKAPSELYILDFIMMNEDPQSINRKSFALFLQTTEEQLPKS